MTFCLAVISEIVGNRNVVECYVQMFTKNAKIFQFLTINVATTNNSALDIAAV